jgi:glucosamine-6-phosphate deaminase
MDVKIFPDREEMGKAAAGNASVCLRALLAEKDEVNCIFAAAP